VKVTKTQQPGSVWTSIRRLLPQIYSACPSDEMCGPWHKAVDMRICNRCGVEVPELVFACLKEARTPVEHGKRSRHD
jgi:hypothetical protein